MADSRVVLMTRGLRNVVTVWRRKPRGPKEGKAYEATEDGEPAIDDGQHTSESAATHVGIISDGQPEKIVAHVARYDHTFDIRRVP